VIKKRPARDEPSYPRNHGDLRGHLYALADASFAIIEYKYALRDPNDTRDFTRIVTKDQISTWNELIAGHFKEIVSQSGLTPAQRRDLLSRKLQTQEILTAPTVSALTNALVIVWKDRTREQLRAHYDPKRLIRRNRTSERDELLKYEEWRAQWIKFANQEEIEAQAQRIAEQAEKEKAAAAARSAEMEQAEKQLKAAKDAEARLQIVRANYLENLNLDYVATVQMKNFTTDGMTLSVSQRREIEVEFVTLWFQNKDNVRLTLQLNGDQVRAIARMDKRLLVRARAGSGKTTTLVARTVFLLHHCKVSPLEIVLFAFNKSAAEKLESDLVRALGLEDASEEEKLRKLPFVQTFDAFAQAVSLLKPYERWELHGLFQGAIDELLDTSRDRVRTAMLGFFRGEWDRIESDILPGQQATLGARRAYQPDGARLTLNGEQVKSRGEHRIANWLFEHGIPYKYERHLRHKRISWAPDFTIYPDEPQPIIVEYLGLEGDPDYDEKTAWKQSRLAEIPADARPEAVWLSPASTTGAESSPDHFSQILQQAFVREGRVVSKLSEDEIWERIKERATSEFREVLESVTGRAYQLGWDELGLQDAAKRSAVPQLIELCADVMTHIKKYRKSEKRSYAEICWSAAQELAGASRMSVELRTQAGKWRACNLDQLREAIVDEFQDFSLRFKEIISSLLRLAPESRFVAVGDDWQAINRYAGSDSGYIEHWEDKSSEVVLPINNRSLRGIVDLGNALMQNRGPLATAGSSNELATILRMDVEELNTFELEREAVENMTDIRSDVAIAISRLAVPHLKKGESVSVLARAKHEIDLVKGDRKSQEPLKAMLLEMAGEGRGHLDVETVHGFKGREADVVILMADNFPLMHPHQVVYEVFGDSVPKLLEDERRLLYVGITRARKTLYLLTGVKRRKDALEPELPVRAESWAVFPPSGKHVDSTSRLVIVLSGWGTNEIKDEIKAAGFKWKPKPLNRWEKTVDKAADPLAVLARVMDAPWFPRAPLASDLIAEVQNIKGEVLARKELVGTERQTRTNLRSISPTTEKQTWAKPTKDIDDLPF